MPAEPPLSSEISNEFIEAVELEVGMGHGAWDCINPTEIIAAVLKLWPEFSNTRKA